MGEDVLLSIDPQIREPFLSRVEDLSQVAEAALLVEYFVCLGKLFTVGTCGAVSFKNFTQSLDLVEEALACSLTIFGVKIVFFIGTLLQMITHHHCILEEQKVGTPPKFFYFGERARRRCLCSDWNQLGELKVILADVVSIFAIHA